MLKELLQLLKELTISTEKYGGYQAVATGFYKQKRGNKKMIRVHMPQNEKEYKNVTRKDAPILEVKVDPNDPEISLITNYLSTHENEQAKPLNYEKLYNEIKRLIPEHEKYEVLSSSWIKLDNDHTGRVDIPIMAVLIDEEEKNICFVETGN